MRQGVRDLGTLTGGAYVNLALGLASVVWTARVLGVEKLGLLAVATGFYFAAMTIVESGCTQLLIADRPFSRGRGRAAADAYRRIRLKWLPLVLVASLTSGVAGQPAVSLAILFGGLVAAYDDSWALYSVGRFSETVGSETLSRIVTLVAVLVVLPSWPSAEVALACTFVGATARLVFLRARVASLEGWSFAPGVHYVIGRHASNGYLASRLVTMSMNQMAPALYSASASLAAVGTFSAADRVVRSVQTGTNYYATFSLPRLARAQADHRLKSAVLRLGIIALALGATITVTLSLAAPWITDLLYDAEFQEAAGALKLYALLIVVSIVSNYINAAVVPVLGNTWVSFGSNLIALGAFAAALAVTWGDRSPRMMVLITLVPEVTFLICLAIAVAWPKLKRRRATHG